MSNVIYIIKKDINSHNLYKVGKYTGSIEKLSSRYMTYYPNHVVLLFIKTSNADSIEDQVKLEFYEYREINKKGNRSEWIEYDLNAIVKYIITRCITDLQEYHWSYNALSKYNSKNALNMFVSYLVNVYKLRYNESNEQHGYSLSRDKVIALSYACYNILNHNDKIIFNCMEEYENHVGIICKR